jgi:Holliday junction resolvasome RuvABC ATP-dependent DNA helicase subunit
MLAAVQHIHQRYGQRVRVHPAQVAVQGQPARLRRRDRHRHRDAQNRVRAQLRLVFRAVQRKHRLVDSTLLQGVHPLQRGRDALVNVLNRTLDALAQIVFGVVVAQFQRFVRACGRA